MSIEQAAAEAVGNWTKFTCFGWHARPDDAEMWFIWYLRTRDSEILDIVNAKVVENEMAEIEEDDWTYERHSHWGPGWLEGVCVRVYDPDGNVTPAFRKVHRLAERLEDYPLLDEEEYYRCLNEEQLSSIILNGRGVDPETAQDGWEYEVFDWLVENEPEALEDPNGYVSEDEVNRALWDLGLLLEEDER